MSKDKSYKRHLPHQVPQGYPIFLTWNLKGSIPQYLVAELELEARRLEQQPPRQNETSKQRKLRHEKLLFAKRDNSLGEDCQMYLSLSRLTGMNITVSLERLTYEDRPMWLADSQSACEVAKSLLWGVGKRYDLWAFVVMGNHVHCLITPFIELPVITQGIKGYTAHQINQLQNARGRVVWQDESYDHWARDEEEVSRIIHYIENNPTAAGLCETANEWQWSSAFIRDRFDWQFNAPFPEEHRDEAITFLESSQRTSAFLG